MVARAKAAMPDNDAAPWAVPHDELADNLGADVEAGLNTAEAKLRLQQYGANALPTAPPVPAWRRMLRQFNNALIYVLLVSGVISLLLDHIADSVVIFVVVLINALIGFFQEGKAENALRAILSLSQTHCLVIRNGQTVKLDSRELVPGDTVLLQSGDRVPADMRLVYQKNLHCDEALLTGESQPSGKNTEPTDKNAALAERKNMAFMGAIVTAGAGKGLVTATGQFTEIGAISKLVRGVEIPRTPLQLQLQRFARQLTLVILAGTLFTIVLGNYLHDYTLATLLQGAIAIAVAAIPEGLPAIVTITLAIGVQRMANNHALVRRLPAVEVLGSVDVICSDKTGTLTANAMTTRALVTAGATWRVTGEAYSPEGCIEPEVENNAKPADAAVERAAITALLCNDARVEQGEQQQWYAIGDPTEAALHVLALKAGVSGSLRRMDCLPFEAERRYMATLHAGADNNSNWIAIKGAPDRLLDFCSHQLQADGKQVAIDMNYWHSQLARLAERGMRVMALACKPHRGPSLQHDDIEQGLVMLALAGMTDPPRKEAIKAIADCHSAGIRVKMITGDNPVTAAAIARELGLAHEKALTGKDIDAMDDTQLATAAETVDVFARTSPENKLQLVRALQRKKHVVAMTGDGVNDAPALRRANIGVAMGRKGTDAAREACDFVLTDDNFATISNAVAEGRTIYDNIVKSILFIMPTSMTEAGVIVMAILFGITLPITAVQVLWVNMATAITLTLALAFVSAEHNIMQKPPRPPGQGLITALLLRRLLLVVCYGIAVIFALFSYYLEQESLVYARTVAVNTLVMLEIFYLFNCRFLHHHIFGWRFVEGLVPFILAALAVVILQLFFTYLPASQTVFGTTGLQLADWGVIIVAASVILWLVEAEKALSRLWQRKAARSIMPFNC